MNVLDESIYDWLAADSTITALVSTRIYRQAAPQDATLPYIVYAHGGGGEENLTPTRSVEIVKNIFAVSGVSDDEAGDIADAIHTRLHTAVLTVTGWTNYWTAAENEIQTHETDPSGVRRWIKGNRYRIRLGK